MKKIMKRIIPLILVVVLIASACWYILVYDRDTVRDFLMAQARNCAENGHFEAATWFYDVSYELAGEDVNVAIDLAEIYKSIGNYTKAEYTLANAIADGPTTSLYIALCRTYVEQDKLLDAVNMLDKIADPAIKAELDAMRPAAPQPDLAPNFYSQYITLNFQHDGGTLYVTTDGEYPSTADTPCTTPIALAAGETKLYALVVGENGLVSPVSILNYTIGGVIEAVTLEDAAIEEMLRTELMVGAETELYSNDLWTITDFTVPAEAQSLNDLAHLTYLERLSITGRTIDSLSFLSGMSHLQELTLSGCTITDALDVIAALPQLQVLNLSGCSLSTIAALENAPALTSIDLSHNAIGDIRALSTIPTLERINLADNAVTDLTALAGIPKLSMLDVSENALASIAPLATCGSLLELNVSQNRLTDISPLMNMTGLQIFRAANNQLADCTMLTDCVELQILDLSNNQITDISCLSGLVKLSDLNFSYNQVTELPALPTDCALIVINGEHNLLSSLAVLEDMANLNYIYMDYNAEISQIRFLADNPNLIQVNVFGTKVTESEANKLLDRSIIVNYDPT